jgi:hypothetical protein
MALGLAWLPVAPVGGQDSGEAAVVELRETISKIVETEALRSKELSDWEARKASMAELLGLHQRELELLGEELEQAGGSADEFAARKDGVTKEVARLKDARDAVRRGVSKARPRMLALAARFPAPLAGEVEVDRLKLEAWREDEEPRPALQALLAMIGAAEQFNRRVGRSVEVHDRREVEVLYLGLARAYYRDSRGGAGVGVPGPGGWTWRSEPQLAGAISSAFDQLDRKRPPELVELPVKIEGKGGAR